MDVDDSESFDSESSKAVSREEFEQNLDAALGLQKTTGTTEVTHRLVESKAKKAKITVFMADTDFDNQDPIVLEIPTI